MASASAAWSRLYISPFSFVAVAELAIEYCKNLAVRRSDPVFVKADFLNSRKVGEIFDTVFSQSYRATVERCDAAAQFRLEPGGGLAPSDGVLVYSRLRNWTGSRYRTR